LTASLLIASAYTYLCKALCIPFSYSARALA
jgi:hypothetical protein